LQIVEVAKTPVVGREGDEMHIGHDGRREGKMGRAGFGIELGKQLTSAALRTSILMVLEIWWKRKREIVNRVSSTS
jgi:hypothetical protein